MSDEITFSIVLPVYNNPRVERAIKSVLNQQYPYFELIIVDDGSIDGITPEVIENYRLRDKRIRVLTQEENKNRVFARNRGMREAVKQWICWLDSDDEYMSEYLRSCVRMIKDNPDYKLFNFAHLLMFPDTYRIKDAFRPEEAEVGHKHFGIGNVGSGSFIWHRELMEDPDMWMPETPECVNPYGFAAESRIDMKDPGDPGKFTDGKGRVGDSLGNPWGDDYCQFYYLTRKHKTKTYDLPIYIVYPKNSEVD